LTEKLSLQLDEVEREVNYLKENEEAVNQSKKIMQREIRDLKRKLEFKNKQLSTANSNVALQK
jgi:hypothetical protein